MARQPTALNPWAEDLWSTFDELRRGIDEVFQRWGTGATPRARAAAVYPPVNLYETADTVILTAELPGLRAEDLQVTAEAHRLTLRGERRIEYPADPQTSLHRIERPSGVFRRTIELPQAADTEKIEAIYRHGVLTVRVPKAPQSRARTVSVKTA